MKQSIQFSLRENGVLVKTLDPRAIILEPVYINRIEGQSKPEIIEYDWCDPNELSGLNERLLDKSSILCLKDAQN